MIALCTIGLATDRRRCCCFEESGCLGVQPKAGGKPLLKLNTREKPIANKYREGKMQRTLKRELKVLEIAKSEAIGCDKYELPNHPPVGGRRGSVRRPPWRPRRRCLVPCGRGNLAVSAPASVARAGEALGGGTMLPASAGVCGINSGRIPLARLRQPNG